MFARGVFTAHLVKRHGALALTAAAVGWLALRQRKRQNAEELGR